MAGPNLHVDFTSSTERAGDKTTMGFDSPAQEACGNGQTRQFSGVLIKLFKVTVGSQTSFISPTFRGNGAEEVLRKPSVCWICSRLLACLSKSLAGRDAAFILGSSTSNCALNHELLIAIRIFLKQSGMSPDEITLESASLGPLRLILRTEAPKLEGAMAAHLVPSGIQGAEVATWKSETAKDSQVIYTMKSYDVYQDLHATTIGVPETWIPKAARIPKDSNSRECLRLARSWLNDCLLDHPRCRMNEIPKLPRRVIDVEGDQLRLVVPLDGTRGHWVALSHCWGQTNTFKTTLKTLKSHMLGIEWEALPKTFKDAVIVTRALEVRYLWLDSLCIVQDDGGTDFHAEAAKMCDIYRNSILTIAASCSASDCAGFLRERITDDAIELENPPRLQSVCLRQAVDHSRMLRDDPIHSRAWTFQETILPRRLLSFGSQEATWECEELRHCECRQIEYGHQAKIISDELGRAAYRKHTRAVIEGRFHARQKHDTPGIGAHSQTCAAGPRLPKLSIVETYTRQLLAEAPAIEDEEAFRAYIDNFRRMKVEDLVLAACLTSINPKKIVSSESRYITCPSLSQDVSDSAEWVETTNLNTLAVEEFYRYWRRVLVPEYTRRAISNDSDRLIALQAIASDVHSGIHDRYLAGIWEGDIINQLCWQSADGEGLPADNQSPSWSWSSVRGPIIPCLADEVENSRFGRWKVAIVSADCSLAGQNPCGRILNGSIVLHASAMEVRYIKNKDTGLYEFHAHASRTGHTHPTVTVPLKLEFRPDTPLGCQSDGLLTRSADKDYLNTRHHDHSTSAVLLLVKCSQNGDFCALVCGRVLAAAEPNTCRRLGIGTGIGPDLESFIPHLSKERFVLV